MRFAAALLVGVAALGVSSTHEGPTLQAEGPLLGLLATVTTHCLGQVQKQILHTAQALYIPDASHKLSLQTSTCRFLPI